MSNPQFWAVVPAAGVGERMQADKPKQYLLLNGQTVIEHTLQRLAAHPDIAGIIVAISPNDDWWPSISVSLDCPLHVVEGGAHRADSVLNGLMILSEYLDDDPWVLVHDAARPCLRVTDIDKMLTSLSEHDVGGILGVLVNDTVKRTNLNNEIMESVDRRNLWRAATPQMFRLRQLKQGLETAFSQQMTVTDEASAIELMGLSPMMVEGHSDNIKITVPEDLALASWFLQQQGEA
ncbi:MAG: 2-C-methyl-D-erythritol 4-phosphate cytidylyltransferase [Gammaproteobacteria bacterium]|jgi:2-C-methyl-D-erythritol 4-phosphate cytidylyltransferase|nr:2-C-methyl-D-erythritol 4-phosphate cytidylyltransferase [Gammaproteobacteria bacterium]